MIFYMGLVGYKVATFG